MGTITVDGKPLEQHIAEESAQELCDQLNEEVRSIKIRRPIVSRKHVNHSGAKSSPGTIVYVAGQRESHVIIAEIEFPWWKKAPFVRSGFSTLGALELDKANDLVKCHECGEWFSAIGRHSFQAHKIGPLEYRNKHGLTTRTRLTSPGQRERERERLSRTPGNMEPRFGRKPPGRKTGDVMPYRFNPQLANLRNRCVAQTADSLRKLAEDLGRKPTCKEIAKAGVNIDSLQRFCGKKMSEFIAEIGIS